MRPSATAALKMSRRNRRGDDLIRVGRGRRWRAFGRRVAAA